MATVIASTITTVGSAGVAITAVLTSWRSSRAALHQQASLVAAEKLWERRADTYVELMAAVDAVATRRTDARTGRVVQLEHLLTADFHARLATYDTGTVRQELSIYLRDPAAARIEDVQRAVRAGLGVGAAR